MSKRDDAIKTVLSIARAEVGVRESPLGSNTGKRIREYQAADTLGGTGYPWCASFTAFCIAQAEQRLGYPVKYLRSASCDLVLAWARENDLIQTCPQAGDTFLVMKSRHDATHTGFVASVTGERFGTVEGNTNDGGSREGVGVFALSHPISERYLFVRWANLLSAAAEPEKWAVVVTQGAKQIAGYKVADQVFVWARAWAHATGVDVDWKQDEQAIYIAGKAVAAQPRFFDYEGVRGSAFLPVRVLAEATGYRLGVNMAGKRVDAYK